MQTHELVVSCEVGRHEEGQALLELLARRFPYHGQARWAELIAEGRLRLNGVPGYAEQVLQCGDQLTYTIPDHQEPEVPQQIELVYETPDFLLVGKPAGTPLHRTGQIVVNTFVNQLRHRFGEDVHPLHRLDQETSGLLLCARNAEVNRRYQPLRDELLDGKFYLALVKGSFPDGETLCEQPLATLPESEVRCRMWPVADGKPCRTHFQKVAEVDGLSLVLAELLTGRRHQIRAHLAALGTPLLADKIYDYDGRYFLKRLETPLTEDDFQQLGAHTHCLHAWAVHLNLPGQLHQTFFSTLFSDDFRRALTQFPAWESRAKTLLAC